jgi:hypothetical protein
MRALYLVPILLSYLLSNCSEQPPQKMVIGGALEASADAQESRPALAQLSQLEAAARFLSGASDLAI